FSSMASPWAISAFFLVSALASIEFSACNVVKGTVSCLDCNLHDDLPEVNVLVKCVKSTTTTTTEKDGSFEAQLPTNPSSTNCAVELVGGPQQLCSYRKTMASKIVKAHDSSSYTISSPLAYSTSCPSNTKSGTSTSMFDSSKTVDFPMPSEWGLPPTSFVIPIIPIGIP
ncbi:hypothetical protein, partial [Ralstonia pseudosolanacearum]|uniref:hypothetical protein n=1 Tax=Ralstonia pseudosolanacearum TaxID=1310165 RepID=UPI003CF37098